MKNVLLFVSLLFVSVSTGFSAEEMTSSETVTGTVEYWILELEK